MYSQFGPTMKDDPARITVSQRLQLLKTALEVYSSKSKLERLSSALKESDESTIAEKIEGLYKREMELSRSNLER